jgi:hypothetical protein
VKQALWQHRNGRRPGLWGKSGAEREREREREREGGREREREREREIWGPE